MLNEYGKMIVERQKNGLRRQLAAEKGWDRSEISLNLTPRLKEIGSLCTCEEAPCGVLGEHGELLGFWQEWRGWR